MTSKTCAASFHWLRQLRRVRKSLDDRSACMLLLRLGDHFTTSSDVASRLRLRSANRHQLIVPRCRLNKYGSRAFPIAGPTVWNSLPDELRDPAYGSGSFKQFLEAILFSLY